VSIQKKYLPKKGVCRVTFQLPPELAGSSAKVSVVGEFKDWNWVQLPMGKGKDGIFFALVDLPVGNEYQFRYLINDSQWENDKDADKQVPSPFGDSQNSVVVIEDR
jgi:1,4-alpha-glucan branching enzyme